MKRSTRPGNSGATAETAAAIVWTQNKPSHPPLATATATASTTFSLENRNLDGGENEVGGQKITAGKLSNLPALEWEDMLQQDLQGQQRYMNGAGRKRPRAPSLSTAWEVNPRSRISENGMPRHANASGVLDCELVSVKYPSERRGDDGGSPRARTGHSIASPRQMTQPVPSQRLPPPLQIDADSSATELRSVDSNTAARSDAGSDLAMPAIGSGAAPPPGSAASPLSVTEDSSSESSTAPPFASARRRRPQSKRRNPSAASRGKADDVTVTRGILTLIDRLHRNDALTCAGAAPGTDGNGGGGSSTGGSDYFCAAHKPSVNDAFNHLPLHFGQHDNWSCGFRNLQMLISSLLPSMRNVFPFGVPTLDELQSSFETLWTDGFDRDGAKHHKRKMIGKKSWIGTVEVWSYLSFMSIDCTIVQFVKTPESRACVGGFVWAYFSKAIGPDGCQCHDNPCLGLGADLGGEMTEYENQAATAGGLSGNKDYDPLAISNVSSLVYARTVLRKSYSERGGIDGGENYRLFCECSLPPLYLQWEGHSVTVVGVRRVICTGEDGRPEAQVNFVVFDPLKKGIQIKEELHGAMKRGRSNGGNAPSYATVPGTKSLVEIPARKLLRKDSQILLCTAQMIEPGERNRRRTKVTFATANPSRRGKLDRTTVGGPPRPPPPEMTTQTTTQFNFANTHLAYDLTSP